METAVQTRQAPVEATGLPLIVRLGPVIELSEDQFFEFCQINRELRIERNVQGELLIMPPAGSGTGERNGKITARVVTWAERDGTGIAFDSSAGFTLPNGAVRSPDASWIARSRWEQVPTERRDKFAPICPDFVLELRSPSDTLRDLQAKMVEYLANAARLGWLLDPPTRHVYIYRPGATVERLEDPETVSGDPVLPGFVLNVRKVW
jgi:Uma2 family endonuclease